MNIYVSNLGFSVMSEDLRKIFEPYGSVSSVNIIMDKFTNRSRGFGFVEMADDTQARKAISELDGTQMEGRSIKTTEARQKEQQQGRKSFLN